MVHNEERLDHRNNSVKPLMDAYFGWVEEYSGKKGLDKSSKLAGTLTYTINQERLLRVFLEDPEIPLDNNDAERSVRSFCVLFIIYVYNRNEYLRAPCC